jgi:hypothetical protein
MIRKDSPTSSLIARERDDSRAAMGLHFGHDPSLAQEMFLPPRHSRPQQGHGRRPAAVQSMLARGLVEIPLVRQDSGGPDGGRCSPTPAAPRCAT